MHNFSLGNPCWLLHGSKYNRFEMRQWWILHLKRQQGIKDCNRNTQQTQIHKFLIKTLLIDKAQIYFFFLQSFVSSLVGFTYLMWFKWHFELSIIMQKRAIYCQASVEPNVSFNIFSPICILHKTIITLSIPIWSYLFFFECVAGVYYCAFV